LKTVPAIEIHSHIHTEQGIALMREEHLSYALLMAPDTPTFELARKHKDIIGTLAFLNPTQPDYLDKGKSAFDVYADVVKGFKIHPENDGFPVKFDLLAGLFALANERECIIQTHTGSRSNAALFKPLLKAFPKTKLILLHGYPAEEAFDLVNSFSNVYIDTSASAWGKRYQSKALKAIGKEKIMMGLDSPLGFHRKNGMILPHFRDAIREIASFYDNDADVLEDVLYKNAAKLLGISNR
jgi:predicted TIM-barrel fold metal-dependent hydrolase